MQGNNSNQQTNQSINNSNKSIQTLQHRWGGLWLAATHRLDLGFPAVVGCALLSSIAIVWLDTADIVTCMLNFPAHGGDVAGAHCRVEALEFSVCRRACMLQQVQWPMACRLLHSMADHRPSPGHCPAPREHMCKLIW